VNRPYVLLPLFFTAACGAPGDGLISDRLALREPLAPITDVADVAAPVELIDLDLDARCVPAVTAAGLRCRPIAPVIADQGLTTDCEQLAVVVPAALQFAEITGVERPGLHRLEEGRSGCFPVGRMRDGQCQFERMAIGYDDQLKPAHPFPPEEWAPIDAEARAEPHLAAWFASVCAGGDACE
jgi:hypothetical protein